MGSESVPRLTVGLPVHNGERYLSAALDSLLGQTYLDFELIVADNASTDATTEICRSYVRFDRRVRYFRHPRNIGAAPNHNFIVSHARGELFKWASHDDLYAPDLLERCVSALDQHPDAVLAHCWTALIDTSGRVTGALAYQLATDSPDVATRLRSMLFGCSGGDDIYGVTRTALLRRVQPHGSHHHADRTIVAEIGLHGPFVQVPDWLYFRRDHPDQAARRFSTVRDRCSNLDPRRASRVRHSLLRLYGEYLLGYLAAIHRAPLTDAERRECHRCLAEWLLDRARHREQPDPYESLRSAAIATDLDRITVGR